MADIIDELRQRVSELEHTGASVHEWRGLDLQIFGEIVHAQLRLVREQRAIIERVKAGEIEWTWLQGHGPVQALVGLLEDLRALRLTTQGRMLEHRVTQSLLSR